MLGYESVKDWYLQSCSPSLLGTPAGDEEWANRLSRCTPEEPWEVPPDEPPEQMHMVGHEPSDAVGPCPAFVTRQRKEKACPFALGTLPERRQYSESGAVLREISDQPVGRTEIYDHEGTCLLRRSAAPGYRLDLPELELRLDDLGEALWPVTARILTFDRRGNALADLRIQRDISNLEAVDMYCFSDVEPLGIEAAMNYARAVEAIHSSREELVKEARALWATANFCNKNLSNKMFSP